MQKCFLNFAVFNKDDDSDDKSPLQEVTTIRSLHEDSQQMLNRYVSAAYPLQPFRLGKLYLTMTSARNVSASVIEDLFFRKTIGPIPLSTVICGMYKTSFPWHSVTMYLFVLFLYAKHINVIFLLRNKFFIL